MANLPTRPVLMASLATFMLASSVHNSAAQMPPAIVAPGQTALAAFHAEGAQVYEHMDGSAVVGKIVAITMGKTGADIPWLRLQVTERRGSGALSGMTTVQQINTQGGAMTGVCDKAGAYHSAPYATDYVFLGKGS